MKQKNLIMLGVAMACGLVAAIAVAQLSAGSGRSGPEMTKAIVAKKDIPVGTKLEEKEIENWVALIDMQKDLVPPDAVLDLEGVKNKEVNRTMRRGNPLTVSDLTTGSQIAIPEGFKQITIKSTPVDAVAGFVGPGSKVDVLYMQRMTNGKSRSRFIMRDMLILAVNMVDRREEKSGRAIPQVESVSMAVKDKQAGQLALAEESGRLKLVLRSPNQVDPKDEAPTGDWIDNPFDVELAPSASGEETKMPTVVYAKKPVSLNTLINKDNVGEFFGTMEVRTAPEGIQSTLDDLKGMYVVRALEPGQNLMKISIGQKPLDIPEVVPGEKPVQPKVEIVMPPKPKLPRFEQVHQAGGQTKRVVYLEVAKDRWKRFESDKEADDYVPESPAKNESKPEENKPMGDEKLPLGS